MFVHANEESNEKQTTKLQERAYRIAGNTGMEMNWMKAALSNKPDKHSQTKVYLSILCCSWDKTGQ